MGPSRTTPAATVLPASLACTAASYTHSSRRTFIHKTSVQSTRQQRQLHRPKTSSTRSTHLCQNLYPAPASGVALHARPRPGGQDQGDRRRRIRAAAESGHRRAGCLRGTLHTCRLSKMRTIRPVLAGTPSASVRPGHIRHHMTRLVALHVTDVANHPCRRSHQK